MCESTSLTHICKNCQKTYLKPQIFKRKISNDVEVISFYKYKEIKELLHTKHTDLGFYIFKILAKNSMTLFAKNFEYKHKLHSIAIDDMVNDSYSHTAILNKALSSKHIKPLHSKLRATNKISYSGKSKIFREQNPRNFNLKDFEQNNLILVDDIITTGSTLNQAISTLKAKNKEVVFCLTLADAAKR